MLPFLWQNVQFSFKLQLTGLTSFIPYSYHRINEPTLPPCLVNPFAQKNRGISRPSGSSPFIARQMPTNTRYLRITLRHTATPVPPLPISCAIAEQRTISDKLSWREGDGWSPPGGTTDQHTTPGALCPVGQVMGGGKGTGALRAAWGWEIRVVLSVKGEAGCPSGPETG